MEHVYEDIVMGYITSGGQRFVCPQFLLHGKDKWQICPDFVAIDIKENTVYVIEVTSGYKVENLANKLNTHAQEIRHLLKGNLAEKNEAFQNWPIKFRAFVRAAVLDIFLSKLNKDVRQELNVKARALESILANWKWHDDAVAPVNPLDGPSFS